MKIVLKNYFERRETVNRLREQMTEINRRTEHLKVVMLTEKGASAAMLSMFERGCENFSKFSNMLSHEESELIEIYKSFSDEEKKQLNC